MPKPSRLRDSTQIVLPSETFERLGDRIESEFTVTIVHETDAAARIIGSPCEIKAVNQFLTRRGISTQ